MNLKTSQLDSFLLIKKAPPTSGAFFCLRAHLPLHNPQRPIHDAGGHLAALGGSSNRLARPVEVARAVEQCLVVVVNLAVGVHGQRDGAGLVELAERARITLLFERCLGGPGLLESSVTCPSESLIILCSALYYSELILTSSKIRSFVVLSAIAHKFRPN